MKNSHMSHGVTCHTVIVTISDNQCIFATKDSRTCFNELGKCRRIYLQSKARISAYTLI